MWKHYNHSLPPLIAEETSHFFPAGAAGPSPPLQPFPLHLEGFAVTDPDGLGDISQGGVLPAGSEGHGVTPCPVLASAVLVGTQAAAPSVQGVEGEAVHHTAAWLGTWGRKGPAVLLGG